jgi:methyl-accepting chemotaxis protein
MNIQKKLILIMLVVSFIPLVLLSGISARYYSNSLEEETIAQCREMANEVKLQIDGYLDRPFTAIKVIAGAPTVNNFDLPQAKKFLVQLQSAYPDIVFCIIDAKGNQLVTGIDVALVNVGDRAYFQSAIKGKEETVSEALFSKNTNRYTVSVTTPIKDTETGSIVGVSQGSIALSKISEFVTKLSTNGAIAYVLDSSGKMLAHPDLNLVKERLDMHEVNFVKEGLTEKKDGYVIIDDKTAGKKIVTFVYYPRTSWLICFEVPFSVITTKIYSLFMVLGLTTIIFLIITGGFVCLAAKRFANPILAMQKVASSVAQGDLTSKTSSTSTDEIGLLAKALDMMTMNLKNLIGQVQEKSEQVAASALRLTASVEQCASAANQVAVSVNEISQQTEQQSQAADRVSDDAEQSSARIQQVADDAAVVYKQSEITTRTAKDGGEAVNSAVRHMLTLEQTIGESSQIVYRLGERSKEIGQIVSTISGIAGQTNLLALNAAIEAARAGEQGRGFAVVAEEVRKLAEQSQDAAKQIAVLIGEIQGETKNAVQAMEEGTSGVKAGTGVVNEAGKAFQEIIASVTFLSNHVEDISAAIKQLAGGSKHIVTSVNEIDDITKATTGEAQSIAAVTEEQSAAMEEIASSSQILANMARELQNAISKFRV